MTELRQALRSLRRSPFYCVTVVGVTALGMALTTTVFAVVDGVMFKPLPYANGSEVFGLSPSETMPRKDPIRTALLRRRYGAVPGARGDS